MLVVGGREWMNGRPWAAVGGWDHCVPTIGVKPKAPSETREGKEDSCLLIGSQILFKGMNAGSLYTVRPVEGEGCEG